MVCFARFDNDTLMAGDVTFSFNVLFFEAIYLFIFRFFLHYSVIVSNGGDDKSIIKCAIKLWIRNELLSSTENVKINEDKMEMVNVD